MPSTIACVSSRATESFLDTIEFGPRAAVRYVRRRRGRIDDRYAKANLYTTYSPADFLDYVNPQDWQRPGGARSVEHADGDPDAAGTGSETTGIAIFDYKKLRAKIGIVNRRLKPTLGYLDPENTRTIPPVAASTGFDILSHAIGSLTTIRYTERPLPVIVTDRVADRSCSTSHEMTGAKRFTSSRTACGTVRDRPMDWERNGGSVAVCGPGAAAPWRQTKGAT